jgi:hypothetical protein
MGQAQATSCDWDVVIVGFRLNAERPAQVLERVLGTSRAEAQAIAKKFPHFALRSVDKARADAAAQALRAAGARVELHPHDSAPQRARSSFVLTPTGRKSLVVVPSVAAASAFDEESEAPSATAARAAVSSDAGRVSVYRLGEIEVALVAQTRPQAMKPAPANSNHAQTFEMRPIGQAAPSHASVARANHPAAADQQYEAASAVSGRSTWEPGDFRVIDDTLSNYGDGPVALELDYRPAPPPKTPGRRRISLVGRAQAFEAAHRGTRSASIVRQLRQGAGTLLLFAIGIVALVVLLGERSWRRTLGEQLDDLLGYASEAVSFESDEPAPPTAERVPNARANFVEARTPGLNRVAIDWPLETGELAHVSCLLLEDPTPSRLEIVRGSRVALAIPSRVQSQLKDHAETLRAARGRDDLQFGELCLAEP